VRLIGRLYDARFIGIFAAAEKILDFIRAMPHFSKYG
jgi:hypothetical protein